MTPSRCELRPVTTTGHAGNTARPIGSISPISPRILMTFACLRATARSGCVATLALALAGVFTAASAGPAPAGPYRLVVAPTVEGALLCDSVLKDETVTDMETAQNLCRQRKQSGAPALGRLLDTLEPGGAQGQVQVGYTLTLQLLALYQRKGDAWVLNPQRIDEQLRLITELDRPVVLYLAADHFDSVGPITDELLKDPQNLMALSDGKPPTLGYFGYRIAPYTLRTDEAIPVNRYRYEALRAVAKKVRALPAKAQQRIVAVNLAGELHQLFPDFENGMGAYQNIRVTDYSAGSVQDFRAWLARKYQTVERFKEQTGLNAESFASIAPPSRNIRTEKLAQFGEHYDAFADGVLPFSGWLWDPSGRVQKLTLYVDGKAAGAVEQGFNRLDVYRAVDAVRSPNVGYRVDYDYTALPPGRHMAQIVAESGGSQYAVAEAEFVVVGRDQKRVDNKPARLRSLKDVKALAGVQTWLDLPKPLQDVYFNPLARDWNQFRAEQVNGFMQHFYQVALDAGLPADKLYSHQIVPRVNSSWNPQLFAADLSLQGSAPWKQGINLYGGAADSDRVRGFIKQNRISDYGVPEFNPQQWKRAGAHLAALQSHLDARARFVSPYYFSLVPQRFKGGASHGVNRMELSPTNPQDGSDQFYRALIEFAAR